MDLDQIRGSLRQPAQCSGAVGLGARWTELGATESGEHEFFFIFTAILYCYSLAVLFVLGVASVNAGGLP